MLAPPKIFVVSNMYVRDQLIKYPDETEKLFKPEKKPTFL